MVVGVVMMMGVVMVIRMVEVVAGGVGKRSSRNHSCGGISVLGWLLEWFLQERGGASLMALTWLLPSIYNACPSYS